LPTPFYRKKSSKEENKIIQSEADGGKIPIPIKKKATRSRGIMPSFTAEKQSGKGGTGRNG